MTEVIHDDWRVRVYYDGECPLCMREIAMLQRKDRHGHIDFQDIASPYFDADAAGKTFDELMERIHGQLPDGTWIEGVEVFRQLYAAIGLGAVVAATKIPGIRQTLDWGYRRFAQNRLRLTGRCADGSCAVDTSQAA